MKEIQQPLVFPRWVQKFDITYTLADWLWLEARIEAKDVRVWIFDIRPDGYRLTFTQYRPMPEPPGRTLLPPVIDRVRNPEPRPAAPIKPKAKPPEPQKPLKGTQTNLFDTRPTPKFD